MSESPSMAYQRRAGDAVPIPDQVARQNEIRSRGESLHPDATGPRAAHRIIAADAMANPTLTTISEAASGMATRRERTPQRRR
ncbi:hypothetical protein BO068_005135 [Escherichia coli]|nr:hypothetical protein [Escherichia coli]